MHFSIVMLNEWLFPFASVILLASTAAFIFSRSHRNALLNRLRIARRRTSGASTPPRSFSPKLQSVSTPDKKEPLSSALSSPDFLNTFPPSRREALLELPEKDIPIGTEPSLATLRDDALPTTYSCNLENEAAKYTATGFSVQQIKALGDFPAYDILSGVPLPQPYQNFDLTRAISRPYRPFRWAYHQTMALTKMEPDWWLEVENTYVARIKEREELFEKHGDAVLQYLPGSELACKEIMEMALQFYCARYPAHFWLSNDKTIFHNGILNKDTDIKSMHPLHVILHNVPEDFAIMLRSEEDGMYYFRAGLICSSLGWNVGTKIGMQLRDIHKHIPDYKEKMSFSMDRYFSKMPTNAPIQRGSWGLEIETPLFMPVGDPHEKYREFQKEDLTIDECYLRVDWQTLRRIPLSGAIVFNFKAVFTPVKEFRDEPYIPALVLKVLKEGKRSLMEYKNTWHVEHVCIPALEEYSREQVAKGLVRPSEGDETWNVTTLEESPYFPGWKEKWHRRQGF